MRLATRVLATGCLTLSLIGTTPAGASSGFGDVTAGTWYEVPVGWMVDNDITTGVEAGCFAPFDVVTRGQIATFLFRLDVALGGSPSGTTHPFDDVTSDWQQQAVAWLHENDITTGTSPTTFSPEDPVTRGQFAALMWRYAKRPPAADHPFDDVTSDWQQQAVAWLHENDITTGTSPTTFSPESVMTRAEAATFMWRFAGEPAIDAYLGEELQCTRELRLALVDAGLTIEEAACAIAYLSDYTVEELTVALIGSSFPPLAMIVDISAAANACLTPDRVDELTGLLF
jgi:hypothetical protein